MLVEDGDALADLLRVGEGEGGDVRECCAEGREASGPGVLELLQSDARRRAGYREAEGGVLSHIQEKELVRNLQREDEEL